VTTSEKKPEATETKGVARTEKQEYEELTATLRKTPASKLTTEQLEQTESGLQAFLKRHPQSKLKPSVHFWLGEVYYGQKDYKRAILEYDSVVTQDAKNAKAPAARLKQGYCFLALKESDKATLFFQEVVSRYPSTKEAEAAKAKLAELKVP
jgi:tol-pal system protein YbgF